MTEKPKCEICDEPMPEGEEVFKFHGYSGPCPKPPKESVTGYSAPSPEQIALVNKFKAHEKALGELFKEAKASGLIDPRTLAVGKTQAQTAYMWLNRAIFQPEDFYE